jgi:hypothetical protein
MELDITYFQRCIVTLEKAHSLLLKSNPENTEHDIYRSACIKEFEIILEQSGKLLRKLLKPYFHSSKAVDQLVFKDVFRHGVLRNLITEEACERWLKYRDSLNNTAHDYGVNFAEETLLLLPLFIADASALCAAIQSQKNF